MINRTIKLRNSTVFLEYDTETQLFDVNSSELNRINFGIEYFKDLTVKMGECEIVLAYNKETKRIDVVSSDDNGNIRHVEDNVCDNVCGAARGAVYGSVCGDIYG